MGWLPGATLEQTLLRLLPAARFEEDSNGQFVIYTGLRRGADGQLEEIQ